MEEWNRALFLMLDAGPGASSVTIATARLLAEGLVWIVPAGWVVAWLNGSLAVRRVLVAAAISGVAGLLANQVIGLAWYHPRPFEAGIGRTLMNHARDGSFPSDHLTLIWAVAFALAMRRSTRLAGWGLAALGLPVAWARIYLGVHFPLDMLGAALVALGSAWLVRARGLRLAAAAARLLQRPYRRVFSGLIEKGWMRP